MFENSMELIQNKKVLEEVRRQFEPVYSDFHYGSAQYKFVDKAIDELIGRLPKAGVLMKTMLRILKEYAKASSKPKISGSELNEMNKSRNFMNAIVYLVFIELLGTFDVDLTILLLVGKGHSLHIESDYNHRYTRHVASLEDLEAPTLSLSTKLDFISSCGLTMFSKYIDRGLRNKIAHLDFEFDKNGEFLTGKRRKKKVDLMRKIRDLMNFHSATTIVFFEQVDVVLQEENQKR